MLLHWAGLEMVSRIADAICMKNIVDELGVHLSLNTDILPYPITFFLIFISLGQLKVGWCNMTSVHPTGKERLWFLLILDRHLAYVCLLVSSFQILPDVRRKCR
jgi:hypothetical protein